MPAWLIDTVDLHVSIHDDHARIMATLACRRNPAGSGGPLILQGEELTLVAIGLNDVALAPDRYVLDDETLSIGELETLPERFTLTTIVRIDPDHNTQLSGLYRSKDGYFSQCEAEGFRRITFFPDRPDVMARYTCTVEANRERFPQLLSNGNLVDAGTCSDDITRHWARWEDPFAKPSYLFALVAAELDVLEGSHVTASGRTVRLAIYVEPGKRDEAHHTLAALKESMRWDEQRFGLEMDLDIFMIVAVGDFNMGAMENKGLNIFNSKYVLATQATATDSDFQNIDRIVAHEYFHNWTGNRVTCRDWFQLSLKEGLTVFRDQEFGADVHSPAVTRIQEVRQLRIAQFPEDAGPMAHPVRPASYAEINNFYTATVYQKGAEVVRMIHTLLGRDGFRKGMDLYFQRHDGQAVTCDDFVAAMQDATVVDLSQFRRWYARAGTPRLTASGQYDSTNQRYTLTVTQSLVPTAYEQRLAEAGIAIDLGPLHIPLALGLVLPSGQDAGLRLAGDCARAHAGTRVLSLTLPKQQFIFEDIAEAPVPSLLRDFSAPVILDFDHSIDDLAHLMAFDSDPFNRWEAGQRLASQILLARITGNAAEPWIPPTYVKAMRRVILDALAGGDPALAAEAMVLPAEQELAEAVAAQGKLINPDRIHVARIELRQHLASELLDDLETVWLSLAPSEPYAPDGKQIGRRALRNICLSYLAESEAPYLEAKVIPRLMAQFRSADNMTDVMAALTCLTTINTPERNIALNEFYAKWQLNTLVIDKWLQVQATSRLADTGSRVEALLKHPAFDIKVPNKVYALVRAFCAANPVHFHAADGSGYRLAAGVISELQAMNPQVAARLARSFDRWRQFDAARQSHALAALKQIQEIDGLPRDVAEVIAKALT